MAHRRFGRHRVFALLLIAVGVVFLVAGASMVVPDVLSLGDYRRLADNVKKDSESQNKPDSDDDGTGSGKDKKKAKDGSSEAEEDSGDDPSYSVDWEELEEEVVDSVAWVSVDNTDIDFPVVQGQDNDWYLYHDAFGRESYANVFLDYRADRNGTNAIVYAHTHWANTGFHQIAEVDEQSHFDQIGTVWYSTPECGTLAFTPVAGITVWPNFQDVQQFSFDVDDAEVETVVERELAEHAARGEWNLALLADQVPDAPSSRSILVATKQGGDAPLSLWWVASDGDVAQIRRELEGSAYHEWIRGLVAQSQAKRDGWEEMVASSERTLVLACCSWPFDDHRTLLICVR